MKTNVRDVGGVQIVELKGKITIGSGDVQLRETINKLVDSGKKNILVDMHDVTTIDSSGIGELVGCYTSVTNKGGKLKLLHLPAEDQRRADRHPTHHRLRRLRIGVGGADELPRLGGRTPEGARRRGRRLRPVRGGSPPGARGSARRAVCRLRRGARSI